MRPPIPALALRAFLTSVRGWFDRLTAGAAAQGVASREIAARYGTHASVFASAGVPSVVFGPGSI
ncbi:MAG: hypothetical protein ACKOWG_02455, partial [Planctomycetia bacterium]